MSYSDVYTRAQKVIEEYEKGNNPALDGYVDAFIASLAYAMATSSIARGNATDGQIYSEYDNIKAEHFQFIMLSHGIPMSVVIGSDVSGRDWFVSCFHTYINQWIEGELL
jgi:hypothetical protein